MVVLVPVPEIAPGFIVQTPPGNPLNTTLPVETEQVGWVMVPTTGVEGVNGCGFITMLIVESDTQPSAFVTVNVYVPGSKPEIVVVEPVPVIPPGLIVHVPAGKPPSITLPVANVQLGCVIDKINGVVGVPPLAMMITFAEGTEVHPAKLVTVKL
jgi:hypothetical protein